MDAIAGYGQSGKAAGLDGPERVLHLSLAAGGHLRWDDLGPAGRDNGCHYFGGSSPPTLTHEVSPVTLFGTAACLSIRCERVRFPYWARSNIKSDSASG